MQQFFLATYDVSLNRSRRRVHKAVREQSSGGQKSMYECHLSLGERFSLLTAAEQRLDADTDSFILIRLDPRLRSIQLGAAQPPLKADDLLYLG
jgi:CRISPR-associated protein Cas2